MAEWQANWWERNKRTHIGDWSITDGRRQVLVPGCLRSNETCETLAHTICNLLNQIGGWTGEQPLTVPIGREPRYDKGKTRGPQQR